MSAPATEDEELRWLGEQGRRFGLPVVDLTRLRISDEVRGLVSPEFARRYGLIPLGFSGALLRVAVSDPLASEGPDSLAHLLRRGLELVLAPAVQIEATIARVYGPGAPMVETPVAPVSEDAEVGEADGPIIQLVQAVIAEGVQRRASDIHFEPLEQRLRVRYRIDGVLAEAENPPKRLQPAIISRLKIMAGISIAEKRLPQDGRIQLKVEGRSLDLRVSSLPTTHGESIVMRVLDQEGLKRGLPELGLLPDDQETFAQLIAQPDGIVLVTGPTGSGKTTTLYGCLHHLNQSDRKIITVEDPVEYQMSGINQVPVRPDVGMTFAAALRAMLRQAPDIVMVGEIRDRETAEISINASLTGHLVLSTLHTNDAPGAVTRLVDIGVKPFLVSAALRGVVAQRLARRVCPECRRPHRLSPSELQSLQISPAVAAGASFFRGEGCPACRGSGYRGRIGIFEILVLSDPLREMIHAGAGLARLRQEARREGWRTLREDGVRKLTAGLTTVEEIASLTVGDAS